MNHSEHLSADKGVLHKPWEHTALKVLSFSGLTTAALALAPVLFSKANGSLGIASAEAITFCTAGGAKGAAGSVAGFLEPLVGTSIAAGGFTTAAVSGTIAIGGMWLANYIDKHTEKGAFRWGAVIRWASLATSVLIALPAILPAIGMGLTFFGSLFGVEMLRDAAFLAGSLGSAGAMSGISTGLGAAGLAGVHALTCALPLGVTGLFLGKKEEKPLPRLQLPVITEGRVMQPAPYLRAVA